MLVKLSQTHGHCSTASDEVQEAVGGCIPLVINIQGLALLGHARSSSIVLLAVGVCKG
jgi:hypothetical protein